MRDTEVASRDRDSSDRRAANAAVKRREFDELIRENNKDDSTTDQREGSANRNRDDSDHQ